MKVIPELKELNLDDNEIKVFLSCLKLGSAKVNDIAKRAELIRTTTYGVLKSLTEKGLISTIIKDNINCFQAIDPKQLVDILEEKKKRISDIIPQLVELKKTVLTEHKVEFFEGKNGLKTVINDLTKVPNQEIKIFGSYANFIKFSKPFSLQYFRKRKEKNINVKAIVSYTKKNIEAKKKEKGELRETRFIQKKELNSSCYIYRNKLAFVSFEEDNLRGIIIQDKELVKLQTILFNNFWEQATP